MLNQFWNGLPATLKQINNFGRPTRSCEDSIEMDLEETGCEDVDWIHMAQYRVQWRIFCVRTRFIKARNFMTS
jgi:hypothetical protein